MTAEQFRHTLAGSLMVITALGILWRERKLPSTEVPIGTWFTTLVLLGGLDNVLRAFVLDASLSAAISTVHDCLTLLLIPLILHEQRTIRTAIWSGKGGPTAGDLVLFRAGGAFAVLLTIGGGAMAWATVEVAVLRWTALAASVVGAVASALVMRALPPARATAAASNELTTASR